MTLYHSEKLIGINECIHATPIFATKSTIGEDQTLKAVCFIIYNFQSSLKLPNDRVMNSTELVIAAGDYIDKFSHDSVIDLIHAFRNARHDGKIFYNKFSQQDLNEILNKHFDEKSLMLEVMNRNPKSQAIAPDVLRLIAKTQDDMTEKIEPYRVRQARLKCQQYIQNPKPLMTEDDWAETMQTYATVINDDND